MKLKSHSKHVHSVLFRNGVEILFSYGVAVAGFEPGIGYFKSTQHYSPTTSGHINNYLGHGVEAHAIARTQYEIDNLVGGA